MLSEYCNAPLASSRSFVSWFLISIPLREAKGRKDNLINPRIFLVLFSLEATDFATFCYSCLMRIFESRRNLKEGIFRFFPSKTLRLELISLYEEQRNHMRIFESIIQ